LATIKKHFYISNIYEVFFYNVKVYRLFAPEEEIVIVAINLLSAVGIIFLVVSALSTIFGLIRGNDLLVKISLVVFGVLFLMQIFVLPIML